MNTVQPYTSAWYKEMSLRINRARRECEEITVAHAKVVGYKSKYIDTLFWRHQPTWKKILLSTVILPFAAMFGLAGYSALKARRAHQEKEKLSQQIEAQQ